MAVPCQNFFHCNAPFSSITPDVPVGRHAHTMQLPMEVGKQRQALSPGFTIDNNARDALMIVLDLGPPSQWDAATEAKMRILISKDQRPQLFLTQGELDSQSAE